MFEWVFKAHIHYLNSIEYYLIILNFKFLYDLLLLF
jgi:hypothetical protein